MNKEIPVILLNKEKQARFGRIGSVMSNLTNYLVYDDVGYIRSAHLALTNILEEYHSHENSKV